VENVNMNPRCVYSPYGLATTPGALAEMEFVSDGFLRSSNGMFGMDGYTLEGVVLPVDSAYTEMPPYDEWPDEFREWLTPEQALFFENQSRYNAFVDEHYTALPEGIDGMLDEYRAERELDPEDFDSDADFALEVIERVQSENTYTMSPGSLPEGRDFVEYFLNENHRGYCVHFATSVALLLRSAGVPARYAEGFVVSPDDPRTKDGWMNIKDSRAHAWAEIYVNGIGWIPVEATPSRRSGIVIPALASAVGEEIPETPPEQAAEESAAAVAVTGSAADGNTSGSATEGSAGALTGPAAEGGVSGPTSVDSRVGFGGGFGGRGAAGGNDGLAVLRVLIVAVAVVLSSVFAARTGRRRRAAEREKRFGDANRSRAALAVYAYAEKLVAFAGDSGAGGCTPGDSGAGTAGARGRESFAPIDEPLGAGSPAEGEPYDSLPENLKVVIMKARFSRREPTEQELKELIAYANELSNRVKTGVPPLRRLIGKYVRGLF
jgi:hypothetical protein